VNGTPLAVLAHHGQLFVFEDRCTHRGGPLHAGEIDGTCVICPWHGSKFDVRDGSVVAGPASAPQPVYEVRVRADDHVEVRRHEEGALRVNVIR
jgi:nitrite reductase/ring-hydroxylating ferredoxin subunit